MDADVFFPMMVAVLFANLMTLMFIYAFMEVMKAEKEGTPKNWMMVGGMVVPILFGALTLVALVN